MSESRKIEIQHKDDGSIEVPAVLRSGNHAAVAQWQKEQALERTKKRRPDLLDEAEKK